MAADDEELNGLWGWDDAPTAAAPPGDAVAANERAPVPIVPEPPAAAPTLGRRPRGPLLAAGALVVVLVAVGGYVWSARSDGAARSAPPPATEPAAAAGSAPGDASASAGAVAGSTGADTASTPADPEADALRRLQAQRDEDLARVTLHGQWVAQLASKYVGITDPYQTTASGSHTFSAADILAEHHALRDADNHGADVVLLSSTDYGRRQLVDGQAWWVTFALGDFGSAADVQAWCGTRFPTLSGDALTNACAPHLAGPRPAAAVAHPRHRCRVSPAGRPGSILRGPLRPGATGRNWHDHTRQDSATTGHRSR